MKGGTKKIKNGKRTEGSYKVFRCFKYICEFASILSTYTIYNPVQKVFDLRPGKEVVYLGGGA
jgi:hypothetical protein